MLCSLDLGVFGEILPPIGRLGLGTAPPDSCLEAHTAASTPQARTSQLQTDEGIQHRDQRHGSHEEHEGGDLEGVRDDTLDGAHSVVV